MFGDGMEEQLVPREYTETESRTSLSSEEEAALQIHLTLY